MHTFILYDKRQHLACHLICTFNITSQNGLGWEGPYRLSRSNPAAMSRDIFHQPRLLRAPSSLALNTAREGASTASLGNLCQGLTTLMVKNFLLISNLNLPSFSLQPFPLVLPKYVHFFLREYKMQISTGTVHQDKLTTVPRSFFLSNSGCKAFWLVGDARKNVAWVYKRVCMQGSGR